MNADGVESEINIDIGCETALYHKNFAHSILKHRTC